MTKVIIAGAAGRMGQRVGYMVNEDPKLTYSGAFEATGSDAIGRDAGEIAGIENLGVTASNDIDEILAALTTHFQAEKLKEAEAAPVQP